MTTYTCDNCEHICEGDDLLSLWDAPELSSRLTPGGVVPDGCCPICGSFAYRDPTTYTVLLQYPDYIGDDTYMTSVAATNPTEALAAARAEVATTEDCDPLDWRCLCIVEGEHNDLNPEY